MTWLGMPRLNLREEGGLASAVMVALTGLLSFWAGLFAIRGSNDPWWHLKTGQVLFEYMREHGFAFPPYDVFTFTGSETYWVNHEWLAQLIFYGVYALGGLPLAIAFKALLLSLTVMLLMGYLVRRGCPALAAAPVALLAVLAMHGTLFLRPPMFTYLFVVLFLHWLLSLDGARRFWAWLAAGVLLVFVWVNLHGGALLGIVLAGFWWLEQMAVHGGRLLAEGDAAARKRVIQACAFLGAITAASFINPFTYHIHLLPGHVLSDEFLVQNLGELQSPDFAQHPAFELMLIGMLLLPLVRRGAWRGYEILAAVFLFHQSLLFLRHIPLAALLAAPLLGMGLSAGRGALTAWLERLPSHGGGVNTALRGVKRAMGVGLDMLLVFLVIAYLFGFQPGKILWRNAADFHHYLDGGFDPTRYPVNAVNFLLRHDVQGPMMNGHNFAGYLIYRLSPETMKVFTDSRFDLWGSRYVKEEVAVSAAAPWPSGAYDEAGEWVSFRDVTAREDLASLAQSGRFAELQAWYESGLPYWRYVLQTYDINFIFFYDNRRIDTVLRETYHGWHLVFHEKGYVIWMRATEANRPVLERFAMTHREQLASIGQA